MSGLDYYRPPDGALYMVLGDSERPVLDTCEAAWIVQLDDVQGWQHCVAEPTETVQVECAQCGVMTFRLCMTDSICISEAIDKLAPWKVFCSMAAIDHTVTQVWGDPAWLPFLAGIAPDYEEWSEAIVTLLDRSDQCGCRHKCGPVLGWHDALCGLTADAGVEVICRTCGRRSFKVCWYCLSSMHGDDAVVTGIYCTEMTKPHEVVTVVEVKAL